MGYLQPQWDSRPQWAIQTRTGEAINGRAEGRGSVRVAWLCQKGLRSVSGGCSHRRASEALWLSSSALIGASRRRMRTALEQPPSVHVTTSPGTNETRKASTICSELDVGSVAPQIAVQF